MQWLSVCSCEVQQSLPRGTLLCTPGTASARIRGVPLPLRTHAARPDLRRLFLPTLPQTSRIFSPSHRRPGVWSGFLGREGINRTVRAKPVSPTYPSWPSGNATQGGGGFSPGPRGACTWPPSEAGGGAGRTGECFDLGGGGLLNYEDCGLPPEYRGTVQDVQAPGSRVRPRLFSPASPGVPAVL